MEEQPAERRAERRDWRAIRPFTQRELLRLFHRDRMVRVTGLPQGVTEMQVLSLFAELSVKSVRLEPCGRDGVSALVDPVEPELLEGWWQRGQFCAVKGLRAKLSLTPTENLLCVAGLPPTVSHARFYKLVRRFGPVSTWFLMTDPQTSLSKGYGFVRHVSFPAALSARAALSDKAMGEYHLFCDWLEAAETFADLNSKCLLVDQIPYLSSSSQLEELLSVVVKPRYCRIYEKFGLLQDWAIVAFLKPNAAEKTRQLCDGALLCGQRIRVVHCIPGNRTPHEIFSEFATRWDKVNGSPNLQPTPPLSEALSHVNNSTSVPPEDTEEICSVMQDAYQSIPPSGGFSGHHRDMHHILRFIVSRVRHWPSQKQIPCDVLSKIIDFECKECSRYFEFIEAKANSCSSALLITGSGAEDDAEKVQSDFDTLHNDNTKPPVGEVAPTQRTRNGASSLCRNNYFQSATIGQEVRSSATDEVLSSDPSTLLDFSDSLLERDFSPDSLLYSSRGQSTSPRENCSPQFLVPNLSFPNDEVDSILQATSEMCLQNRSSTPLISDSSRNMLTLSDGFPSLTQATSAMANNVASYTRRGRTDNLTQPTSAMQNLAQSTSEYGDLHQNAAYTQPVLGVQSTTAYYTPNLSWRVPSYTVQHPQTVETICQRNPSVSSQISIAHQNSYGSRRRMQRQPQDSALIRPAPATQNFLTGGAVSRPSVTSAELGGWTMGKEFVPESDSDTNSSPYGSPGSGRRTLLPLPNLNVNWPHPGQDYASNFPHYAWPVQEINTLTEDNVVI